MTGGAIAHRGRPVHELQVRLFRVARLAEPGLSWTSLKVCRPFWMRCDDGLMAIAARLGGGVDHLRLQHLRLALRGDAPFFRRGLCVTHANAGCRQDDENRQQQWTISTHRWNLSKKMNSPIFNFSGSFRFPPPLEVLWPNGCFRSHQPEIVQRAAPRDVARPPRRAAAAARAGAVGRGGLRARAGLPGARDPGRGAPRVRGSVRHSGVPARRGRGDLRARGVPSDLLPPRETPGPGRSTTGRS